VAIGRTNLNAVRLRRDATDAEQRLWSHLRDRQLGGFKFRRQVTIGRYIADFACAECKLIVEADGGQHSEAVDKQRTTTLETLGWRVLRFWNNDVLTNTRGVLETVLRACEQEQEARPSPNPLPLAGEG